MAEDEKRIAPRRDELITSDNRMTQRFAEFLEQQADEVNTLNEKSGVQDSLIALSNRTRGKVTALEQKLSDLEEMIFELSARKKPIEEESESDDERFALNRLHNKVTQLTNKLEDIEAEAVHVPRQSKASTSTTLGPVSSTDNAAARFDGITGTLIQDSGVIIDDSDNITGLGSIDMTTVSTSQLIVPSSNDAVSPTLAFGDGDSGFYETNDDEITVGIAGAPISIWSGTAYSGGTTTANPSMLSEVSSATNPVWSFVSDNDTGIGRGAADGLSLIAGGVEVARATTTSLDFNQDLVAADGKGLDFSAFTDGSIAGTMTSQILLDYEEGTWTPVLSDGTNTATHTVQVGSYTKIGRMVHIKGRLTISSLTGSGTVSGGIRITGLPYTSANVANDFGSVKFGFASALNITATENLSGIVNPNTSHLDLTIWSAATGVAFMDSAEWSDDGDGIFDAIYYV